MPNQDQPEIRSRDLAERVDPVCELPDGTFKRLSELTDDEAKAGYGIRTDLNQPADFDQDQDLDETGYPF